VLRIDAGAAPAVGPTWIVHGTKGSFIKYGMDPQEARSRRPYAGRARLGQRAGGAVRSAHMPEKRAQCELRSSFTRIMKTSRRDLGKSELALHRVVARLMRGLELALASSEPLRTTVEP